MNRRMRDAFMRGGGTGKLAGSRRRVAYLISPACRAISATRLCSSRIAACSCAGFE